MEEGVMQTGLKPGAGVAHHRSLQTGVHGGYHDLIFLAPLWEAPLCQEAVYLTFVATAIVDHLADYES